jgi:hypothetical protein
MTKKATATIAQIKRGIKGALEEGLRVIGIKYEFDGAVTIIVRDGDAALVPAQDGGMLAYDPDVVL